MCKWLRKLLLGPRMTEEERKVAIKCYESMAGQTLFHLDGPAAEQVIKEFGFPVRGECNGERFLN
jgi:hypothetical protein